MLALLALGHGAVGKVGGRDRGHWVVAGEEHMGCIALVSALSPGSCWSHHWRLLLLLRMQEREEEMLCLGNSRGGRTAEGGISCE